MRVRHKGLMPPNIGIKDGKIILYGFSISTYFADESSDSDGEVTMFSKKYAAPEVREGEIWGSSSDVFSLGCVFFELLVTFSRNNSRLDVGYGEDPEKVQSVIAQLEGLPVDVRPVSRYAYR